MDELLTRLAEWLSKQPEVLNAEKIDGEHTVGIEMQDGSEFFLPLEVA